MSSRVREDIIMAARQWANAKALTAVSNARLRYTGQDPEDAIANARVDETNAMEEFFRVLDQGLARVADGPGPQQGEVSGVRSWPRVLTEKEVAEVYESERDHPHPTTQAAQVPSGEWHHVAIDAKTAYQRYHDEVDEAECPSCRAIGSVGHDGAGRGWCTLCGGMFEWPVQREGEG